MPGTWKCLLCITLARQVAVEQEQDIIVLTTSDAHVDPASIIIWHAVPQRARGLHIGDLQSKIPPCPNGDPTRPWVILWQV